MHIIAMADPAQEGITRDNVTVRVDAVVYFRVVDPIKATINVQNYMFAISQQAVSRHLKVLERAGLISRTTAASARPCRLEAGRLDDAAAWIARHRQLWADRYDRLDDHLAALRRGHHRSQQETT